MASCVKCSKESILVSGALKLCNNCIKKYFHEVNPFIKKAHEEARKGFGLPAEVPEVEGGVKCKLCINECTISPGERSYCGLKIVKEGKLMGADARMGNLSYYYDPLPTNCVADWVCPGGTGAGYPRYAYSPGPEYGYKNLAVFYQACSFDCLFCQNWHFRYQATSKPTVRAEKLAEIVDERTSCICYFGGDPTPQLPHAILTSKFALERTKDRILRICWETNGSMHPNTLKEMAELSLKSGGCIKFDLKAFSEELNIALCGVSNKQTLVNFELLSRYIKLRPSPPLLIASTLLVPGYVDTEEVYKVASFIASLDPHIPYALLGFYPHFFMNDLPNTSRRHAEEALEAASSAGLKKVHLGNIHLLGDAY